MKRLTVVMVLVCMFSLLVVPVGAIDVEGTASYRIDVRSFVGLDPDSGLGAQVRTGDFTFPRTSNRGVLAESSYSWAEPSGFALDTITIPPSVGLNLSGTVGVYFSYLAASTGDANIWYVNPSVSPMENIGVGAYVSALRSSVVSQYYDINGMTRDFLDMQVDGSLVSEFGTARGLLVTFEGRIDEAFGLSGFYFAPSVPYYLLFGRNYNEYKENTAYFYVPAFSIVAAQSSSELDALENMAAQITQQNQILEAMQGDLILLLQQISNKVSTEETLRLATQYLLEISAYSQQISSDLRSVYTLLSTYLHYLQQIAATADDIYAELQTFHDDFILKLDLLISTIMTESDDIQATMDRIYQQLISYLEATYTEAINPEFEDTREGFDGLVDDTHAIEQEWTGSLSDAWDALDAESVQLDGSLVSGVMWVSSWMQNIFNAAGPYRVVILLSLYVGVCRFILGVTSVVSSESVDEDAGADDG